MRKITRAWDCHESDLYQWWRGSKLCLGACECIITLEEEEQGYIQVWVRGPRGTGLQCFSLLGIIVDAVEATIEVVAPGMLLERHWQSPSQLRDYDEVKIFFKIYFLINFDDNYLVTSFLINRSYTHGNRQ